MQAPIYLDNAATTQVSPQVSELVIRCMREEFGNPASAHHFGGKADALVKNARERLLTLLGDPEGKVGDIFWTSGGTESDAIGLLCSARARRAQGKHLVISAIEHSAIRESANLLTEEGFEVSVVPVNRQGVVDPEEFASHISEKTVVAALMLVNNELGTIQPVRRVAAFIRKKFPTVHLHCDAVQGFGKLPLDVLELGADSIALSAHKLSGPKGVGALWRRSDTSMIPLWSGGRQQGGLRSGTLNVPGIAAMGLAAEIAYAQRVEAYEHAQKLQRILLAGLARLTVKWQINGDLALRVPHILSLAFAVPAYDLMHVLESRGVLVSGGSACAERDRRPSPVLAAIGLGPEMGTIRCSFSCTTTEEQVAEAATKIAAAVRELATPATA